MVLCKDLQFYSHFKIYLLWKNKNLPFRRMHPSSSIMKCICHVDTVTKSDNIESIQKDTYQTVENSIKVWFIHLCKLIRFQRTFTVLWVHVLLETLFLGKLNLTKANTIKQSWQIECNSKFHFSISFFNILSQC